MLIFSLCRGLMGRCDAGYRTVPRHAPPEWHCEDSERHQGGEQDGQEARVQGQGCGRRAALEGRRGRVTRGRG